MGDLNAFTRVDYTKEHWAKIKAHFESASWVFPKDKVIPKLKKKGFIDLLRLLQHRDGQRAKNKNKKDKEPLSCPFTVWVGNPLLRIDYIFGTSELESLFSLLQCAVIAECTASDHFPVLLDMK